MFRTLLLVLLLCASIGPAAGQSSAPDPGQVADELTRALLKKINYRPWIKLCWTNEGQRYCVTRKEGRLGTGVLGVVAVALFEPASREKKILWMVLPPGLRMSEGIHFFVDDGEPSAGSYGRCYSLGCAAIYEASEELIGRLKNGKLLTVQGIDSHGRVLTAVLPLADFANVYDGPGEDSQEYMWKRKWYLAN
jgi:invasion protein IalB